MDAPDLIRKKRNGQALIREEIFDFVARYTRGDIPDYQASALMMAIFFRGLDSRETADLTEAMMRSGEVLDFSEIPLPKADKHSTGGVGDKATLVLAPLLAACGVKTGMMSGRGLGHTGGTLDKLEAIPGFVTGQSREAFDRLLETVGCALIAAGLGRLGLNNWLITEKGCCGRLGTFVTEAFFSPTLRPEQEFCLQKAGYRCSACR